jgi:hypothetical protein
MRPQRGLGVVTATVLAACVAAWLTPHQSMPHSASSVADDLSLPVVFTLR